MSLELLLQRHALLNNAYPRTEMLTPNFSRQGAGGRTHLMSPVMAAAAAIVGKLADVRNLANETAMPAKASAKVDLKPEMADVDSEDDMERLLDLPEDQVASSDAPKASAGLPPFTTLKGIAAPLERSNVDTDAIIPKQFLKTIKRTGLGSALFNAWRYSEDGSENPDFILNKKPYRHASILVVTGVNFGCGSSREHAYVFSDPKMPPSLCFLSCTTCLEGWVLPEHVLQLNPTRE